MTKKTYKVLSPIKHDGGVYRPGGEKNKVSLDDDHAALLMATGAIASKPESKTAVSKAAKQKAQAKSKAAAEAVKPAADAQGSADT